MKISWLDTDNKTHHSFPDFFIDVPEDNESFFLEIKGTYTRKIDNHKIMKAKDVILKMGIGYIIMTITPQTTRKMATYKLEVFNA